MKIFIGKKHSCDLNYTYRFLLDELYELGEIVEDVSKADIIVFPATCCGSLETIEVVMIDILSVLGNKKSDAITFVTGCMTRNFKNSNVSSSIQRFLNDNFDYIIAEDNVAEIVNIIAQKEIQDNSFGCCFTNYDEVDLYISRGCENQCSFCKMTYQNAPIKSVDYEEIKQCIVALPNTIHTANLYGTNSAQYGLDFGYKYNLMDIVKLAENKDSIDEIAIYGCAFKDAILNRFGNDLKYSKKVKKIVGSIETGSPRLLAMMNKGYTIPQLLTFCSEIQEKYPKSLVTDIIAGFPTETYEDIELTIQILEKLKPEEVRVHKYQNSPFVPASKFEQLTKEEINEHYEIYRKALKLTK